MKTIMTLMLLMGVTNGALAQSKPGQDMDWHLKVIYGEDNRQDLYEIKGRSAWKTLANSTVALMKKSDVKFNSAGDALLPEEMIGDQMKFCQDERFYEEQTAAFCSGALVGKDLVLTAGHCIRDQADCDDAYFVFGYQVKEKGKHPLKLPGGNVYGCTGIIAREQNNNGSDWALIRLNDAVTDRRPIGVDLRAVEKGKDVVVIGYPSGLPVKVAGGAKVRDASNKGYFTTNLDTYGGNSGSPVFSKESGRIVGVLVRGDNDYVMDEKRQCRVSNRCDDGGCRGEDVTKVDAFYKVLDRARRSTTY